MLAARIVCGFSYDDNAGMYYDGNLELYYDQVWEETVGQAFTYFVCAYYTCLYWELSEAKWSNIGVAALKGGNSNHTNLQTTMIAVIVLIFSHIVHYVHSYTLQYSTTAELQMSTTTPLVAKQALWGLSLLYACLFNSIPQMDS